MMIMIMMMMMMMIMMMVMIMMMMMSRAGVTSLAGSVMGGTGPGCGGAGTWGLAWETARYRDR